MTILTDSFLLDSPNIDVIICVLAEDKEAVSRWSEIKDALLSQCSVHKFVIQDQIRRGKPFLEFGRKTLEKWIEVEGNDATFDKLCLILRQLSLQNVEEKLKSQAKLAFSLMDDGHTKSDDKMKMEELKKSPSPDDFYNEDDKFDLLQNKNENDNNNYNDDPCQIPSDSDGDNDKLLQTAILKYSTLKQTMGKEHEETIEAKCGLAVTYETTGNVSKALKLYRKVCSIREKVQGNDHKDTMSLKRKIASLSDMHEESTTLLKEVYDSQVRIRGIGHEATQEDCIALAEFLRKDGARARALDEACALYLQLYETRKAVNLGEEDILTLKVKAAMASILKQRENYIGAIDIYSKIFRIMQGLLGDDHELVLKTKEEIVETADAMEDSICDVRKYEANRQKVYQPILSILQRCEEIEKRIEKLKEPVQRLLPLTGIRSRLLGHDITPKIVDQSIRGENNIDSNAPSPSVMENIISKEDRKAETMTTEELEKERLELEEELQIAEMAVKPNIIRAIEASNKRKELIQAHQILARVSGYDNPSVVRLRNKIMTAIFKPKHHPWELELAIEQNRKLYQARCLVLNEKDEGSTSTLSGIITLLGLKGDLDEALTLSQQIYGIFKAEFGTIDSVTLRVMNTIAIILMDLGRFEEAIVVLNAQLEIQLQIFGDEAPEVLHTMLNIGRIYQANGDDLDKALGYLKKLNEVQVRILGEEHGDSLFTSITIGTILSMKGEPKEAIEIFKKIVETAPKNWIEELSQYTLAVGKLGIAEMMHMMVESDKSKEISSEIVILIKETIQIFEDLFGESNKATIHPQNNLVDLFEQVGDLDEALALERNLYEIQKAKLGEEDPITVRSKLNIANLLEKKGLFEETTLILSEVYEFEKKIKGEDDPVVINLQFTLVMSKLNCGLKVKDAVPLLKVIYLRRKKVLGEEHKDTIMTQKVIAAFLEKLEETDEALQTKREICKVLESSLGNEHEDTLQAKKELAHLLTTKSLLDEAVQIQREVCETLKCMHGESHEVTLNSLVLLAGILSEKRLWNETMEIFETVLAIHSRELGEEHKDTLRIMYLIGVTYERIGKKNEAKAIYSKLYEIYKLTLGENHKDTFTVKGRLAATIIILGEWNEGEALLKSMLESCGGEQNLDSIILKHDLADLMCQSGRFVESMQLFQETIQACEQKLGPDHGITQTTKHNIGNLFLEQGNYVEARRYLEEVSEFHLKASGENDDSYIMAKFTIGEILDKSDQQEDKDKALQIFREVYRVQTEVHLLPPEDTLLGVTKRAIAANLTNRSQTAEAKKFLDEALKAHTLVYGDYHIYTFWTRRCIADNLAKEGQIEDSIKMYEDIIRGQKKKLGKDHPHTLRTEYNLASVIEVSKRKHAFSLSLEMYKDVFERRKRALGVNHPETRETQESISILSVKIARKMNSKCIIS